MYLSTDPDYEKEKETNFLKTHLPRNNSGFQMLQFRINVLKFLIGRKLKSSVELITLIFHKYTHTVTSAQTHTKFARFEPQQEIN